MARGPRFLGSMVVLVAMLVSMLSPVVPAAAASGSGVDVAGVSASGKPFVHPWLLSDEFWRKGVLGSKLYEQLLEAREEVAAKLGGLGFSLVGSGEPVARVIVLVPAGARPVVERVLSILKVSEAFPAGGYVIVTGWATRGDVELLAETSGVAAVLPGVTLDFMSARPPSLLGRFDPDAFSAPAGPVAPAPAPEAIGGLFHYTVNLTGAVEAWGLLNTTGEHATIAIIDTGVDYASAALGEDAIARCSCYYSGHGSPFDNVSLILDDDLGLVLTPVKVEPVETLPNNDTIVYVNTSRLYYFMPLLDWFVVGNLTLVYAGGVLDVWAVPEYWEVPSYVNVSEARFGIASRVLVTPAGIVVFPAPVLVFDSNLDNDSYYDTVLVDLSTAYSVFYSVANASGMFYLPPPPAGAPDYNFSDEEPVRFGGSEIAALDVDGDGFYDFSVGTLAGYVHDTLGLVLAESWGLLEYVAEESEPGTVYDVYGGLVANMDIWRLEPHAAVWPGFDWREGRWVVLSYDFYGHGTFCASTAAGRPVPGYTGYGGYGGWNLVVGQAPGARIAAAPALYAGDVIAAIYFFSGFMPQNPYGFFTGDMRPVEGVSPWINFTGIPGVWLQYTWPPLVDLTSNSWGVSVWQVWGWASGLDPLSAAFDYTSYVTGITHFVAAGNGGPGWGTVTVPGASAFAVTVGAATEFTYRPLYGYLPGGNREIVSWSDRGPAETGLVKPDIAAIGSFAYAVGRPWDSLSYGVLSGVYAVDLFGGTSQATPMAAGVAALMVSYVKKTLNMTGGCPCRGALKTLLMLSSSDTGFDPMSQGAGFVNATAAALKLKSLMESLLNGTSVDTMIAASPSVARYMASMAGYNYGTMNYDPAASDILVTRLQRIREPLPAALLMEPKLVLAGAWRSIAKAELYLLGEGRVRLHAVQLAKTFDRPLAVLRGVEVAEQPGVVWRSGAKIAVNFSGLGSVDTVPIAYIDLGVVDGYDMVEIAAAYPLRFFDPAARNGDGPSPAVFYNGLELWYWIDLNRDGVMQRNETARIQYDLRGANAFHIQVADLKEQIREIEKLASMHLNTSLNGYPRKLVLVYRVFDNGWSGSSEPAVALFDVRLRGYKWKPVRMFFFPPRLVLDGETPRRVIVAAKMPPPGVYAGYVVVENLDTGEKLRIPFSIVSSAPVRYTNQRIGLSPSLYRYLGGLNDLYMNSYLRGAFDWTWRYESGDWRVIPVKVTNPHVKYLVVEVKWPRNGGANYASNLDVAFYGPYTYRVVYSSEAEDGIAYAYKAEVNGLQLGGELTVDFTGYWDDPEPGVSRIIVPVPKPGTYLLVVRNIEYSGESTVEPFTVNIAAVSMFSWPKEPRVYAGRDTVARLFIRVKGYMDFSGLSIERLNETLVRLPYPVVDDTTGYVADMLWIGEKIIDATVAKKMYWSSSRLSMAYIMLRLSFEDYGYSAPNTLYALPMWLETSVPVWSVGYKAAGEVWYEWYWYKLPLTLMVWGPHLVRE